MLVLASSYVDNASSVLDAEDYMRYLYFLLLVSCSTTSQTKTVSVARDVVITESGKSKKLQAGETFELKDQPIYLDAPGYTTLLVVPDTISGSKITLDLIPVIAASDGEVVNSLVSQVLPRVTEVQSAILSGDCLAKAESLVRDFPQASYLKLLLCSCLTATGKKEEAKTIAKGLLRDFPQDETLMKFIKSMGE